ncbi:MAG: hypothetical protein GY783_03890 [Gammaproteobacteria bacterium]|nr:hypothetical protein [Gammaproteobacteria bacterium]
MTRLIFALLACSFVLLGAACGQSGPLYLPGDPSRIQNPPPAPADAEEEEEKEDADPPAGF